MKWFFLGLILIIVLIGGTYWVGNTLIMKAGETAQNTLSIRSFVGLPTTASGAEAVSGSGAVDANINFKGHWITTPIKHLERVNLSCIDEFSYTTLKEPATKTPIYRQQEQQYTDENCINYADVQSPNEPLTVHLYRCPLHNCAMKEVIDSQFIPESIDVGHVTLSGSASVSADGKMSLPFIDDNRGWQVGRSIQELVR